jgi:hypothetical protein
MFMPDDEISETTLLYLKFGSRTIPTHSEREPSRLRNRCHPDFSIRPNNSVRGEGYIRSYINPLCYWGPRGYPWGNRAAT